MQSDRLFWVPRTVGLGLDLLRLEGGGAAPAEFHGLTHEGRKLYARYRGGELSVYIANAPEGDSLRDGSVQFVEQVGPPLHGAMGVGQLCAAAGLTVRGHKPPLPDATELASGTLRDLQPGTGYYQVWLSLTPPTAQDWLLAQEVLLRLPGSNQGGAFQGVRCRKPADLTGEWFRIVLGGVPEQEALADLLNLSEPKGAASGQLVLDCTYGGFNWPTDLTPRKPPAAWGALDGPVPRMAGHDPDCITRTLVIEATIPAGDAARLDLLQGFDKDLDAAFPETRLLAFDLKTRDRRPQLDRSEPMDPRVVAWISGGADRWQWITNVGTPAEPDLVGFRPAPRQKLA